MSYYDVCCRYHGRVVTITDNKGKRHTGKIASVTRKHVFIEPIGGSQFGGFSYGYYGGYRPYGYGYAYPVALAAIAGFALGAAFFW